MTIKKILVECTFTLTSTMNATTRVVLDSIRTMLVWVISLHIPWQRLQPLQPVGYILTIKNGR